MWPFKCMGRVAAVVVTVTLSSCDGGGSNGSAEPPEPRGLAPGAIVVDNGQAGTSSVGKWTKTNTQGSYGRDGRITIQSGSRYTWQTVLPSGDYDVYAWWTALASRSTAVKFEVAHADGTATKTVNQRLDGSRWNALGSFSFSGTATVREISTQEKAYTCADAVAFSPAGVPLPPTDKTLAWTAPTKNADGTACDDLAGFMLAWGDAPGDYGAPEDVGMTTAATIEDLPAGTWYAVVTAYDDAGNVSAPSAELVFSTP